MRRELAILLSVFVLTSYMFISGLAIVRSEKDDSFQYELVYYNGILVTLETPWYVNSNSTFNVTLKVEAVWAYLEDIIVNLTDITTFIDDDEISLLLEPLLFMIDKLDINHSQSYGINITLPENASKMVMGEITCEWRIRDGGPSIQHTKFPVAIIADYWKQQADYWRQQAAQLGEELDWYKLRCDELEGNLTELQRMYNELNQTYYQLNQTYRELEDEYYGKLGELGATQRLAVIFGITTALFVATTLYLFKRKPRIW